MIKKVMIVRMLPFLVVSGIIFLAVGTFYLCNYEYITNINNLYHSEDPAGYVILDYFINIYLFISCPLFFAVIILGLGIMVALLHPVQLYCLRQPHPFRVMHQIEEFYKEKRPVRGLRVNTYYFIKLYNKGRRMFFMLSDDLLWVYKDPASDKSVILRLKKHRIDYIDVENSKEADVVFTYIAKCLPYVYLGYSKEIHELYQYHIDDMINNVNKKKRQYM